jgi:hypothetical protein
MRTLQKVTYANRVLTFLPNGIFSILVFAVFNALSR